MDLNYDVPNNFLPKYYNRVNVMNDTNGSKGICKYVNDEIYNSKACFNKSNPQGAYYSQGKYYFDFPTIWYNANSVNKAIGLRSINVYPKPYNFLYKLEIDNVFIGDVPKTYEKNLIFIADPKKNTEEIISGMAYQMNQFIKEKKLDTKIGITYFYTQYNEVLFILNYFTEDKDIYIKITNPNDSFIKFFGEANYELDDCLIIKFKNVWNRRDLFIHASFVNYTSYNYLGKDGEFYPKISKIYDFNYNPQKFYFEISFDGMNPVIFDQVDFLVGICFIVDEKKYNGE